jgi:hypothetical protein
MTAFRAISKHYVRVVVGRTEQGKEEAQAAPARFQRIVKAGVKYAGKTRHQASALMFGALHDLGMSSADII